MRIPPIDRDNLKWLYPGLGIKRWLLLFLAGIVCLSLSIAYVLVTIYREQPLPAIFYYLTLQFLPRLVRAALFGALGVAAVVIALLQLKRSLLPALWPMGQPNVVEVLYRQRRQERGPRVVTIGGGTGLSTLLRGLKEYTSHITAIVTVADDGGSSGRLRRSLGVLPPGDIRNCLAALADDEDLLTQLFQYRFAKNTDLNGHSFGNLFIAAMAEVTGSFERAVLESSRVLAVQGRIVPSTLQDVILCADLRESVAGSQGREAGEKGEGGERTHWVEGESRIPEVGLPIERVFLRPDRVRAYPGALRAILEADLIVAGPGSLFTSILPNLLVEDIVKAIRASRALKVYVCNVATQRGETDGFTLADHVAALERHVGRGLFPIVLANDNLTVEVSSGDAFSLVALEPPLPPPYQVITADVIDPQRPWRHDPAKLAAALMALYRTKRT